MTGPIGMARALLGRWQAQLDSLYDAALAEPDAAARDRLLAQAAAIEACDMDVRRAVRADVCGMQPHTRPAPKLISDNTQHAHGMETA